MEVIKGEDLFVELGEKKCLHATKHTLSVSLSTEELSTIHAMHYKYAITTDWEAQADGVMVVDTENAAASNTAEELLDMMIAKTPVSVTLKCSQSGLLTGTYTGTAYIDRFDIDSEVANRATYSVHLTAQNSTLTKVTA